MRLRAEAAVLRAFLGLAATAIASGASAAPWTYRVLGGDPAGWSRILSSIGFQPRTGPDAAVEVVRAGAGGTAPEWRARVEQGTFLILEGESALAASFGFRPGPQQVRVQSVRDTRRESLAIIWEKALEMPVFQIPEGARVFARERWQSVPVMAGFRLGAGAVLWVASDPGQNGYERFPYLLHALSDLGLEAPFRSRRIWAFFDSSYRARADLDYLAARWRSAGIAALHVAAWHFLDAGDGAYLRDLIASCHRHGILVYAWLELPHVSERFWNDHPEWREKTALLQDAHLDWRKLMNLASRACRAAAAREIRRLLEAFDWDGVNLAELYFESLEGVNNPARFTPLNDDVRREFQRLRGFDPLDLFQPESPRRHTRNPDGLRAFLDYRAELARRIETEWLDDLEKLRVSKPDLDLVLTHVDDYFDSGIRDSIGADAARVLPLLNRYEFTFLVEDPATVWHLGPRRYAEIGLHYRSLTRRADKLAVDINVVERYQDVYPTKQQTGTELFQLVQQAAQSFSRVALYFENSILPPDLPLLPCAAAVVNRVERLGAGLSVDSPQGVGVPWKGPALVDGRPWPAADGSLVWLPAGAHVLEPGGTAPAVRLLDFNGDLKAAMAVRDGVEFAYRSSARALALLDRRPERVEIDGGPSAVPVESGALSSWVLLLPRGQHLVRIRMR